MQYKPCKAQICLEADTVGGRKASWLSSDPRFETRIVTRATSPLDTEKMQLILSTISAGESHGRSITLF